MTDLNILIATRNGGALLPRVLDGYLALGDAGVSYKIIVVDNGSDDDTGAVLQSYSEKLPLAALHEPEPGKNRALNTGLAALGADRVILSDDDAIPHAGFLGAWMKAFDAHPDADVFGGAISPLFDVQMPDWMLEQKPRFEELYARREGVEAGPISPDFIFGPNMAARRRVFDTVRFDDAVGPNGAVANYAMGSETDFCRRAEAAGFKLVFAPQPAVSHIVRQHQTEREFFVRRAYRLGLGTAHKHWQAGELSGTPTTGAKALAARAYRAFRAARIRTGVLNSDPAKRFDARWDHAFFQGYQDGFARLKADAYENSEIQR